MEHLLLSCIESRIENNRSLYSCFQLGPFDKGQGLTVANAMRRTLLSELSALAIVCVEIQGISHEYSSIKGVRESVLDILLNLKQIIFISNSRYTSPEVGFLKTQGPAIIKSGDLKLPTHLQCVDPNQYIATVSDNTCLEIKFMICNGKNFVIQTSFALISKTFHAHFSNKQKENIMLLTKQKSKPLPAEHIKSISQPITHELVTFQTQGSKQIDFEDLDKTQALPGSHKKVLPSFPKKTFQALKLKASGIKSQDAKHPGTEYLHNTQVHRAFLEQENKSETKFLKVSVFNKHFFKKIEQNLLYSSLHISELQVFRNMVYKENLKKNSVTNILLIDSVFMPVIKVNFSIKNINTFYKIKSNTLINKFKKNVSQEKIFLEVWTNGSIDPKNAIHLAAQQIIDILIPLQKTYFLKKNEILSVVESSKAALQRNTGGGLYSVCSKIRETDLTSEYAHVPKNFVTSSLILDLKSNVSNSQSARYLVRSRSVAKQPERAT